MEIFLDASDSFHTNECGSIRATCVPANLEIEVRSRFLSGEFYIVFQRFEFWIFEQILEI